MTTPADSAIPITEFTAAEAEALAGSLLGEPMDMIMPIFGGTSKTGMRRGNRDRPCAGRVLEIA